MISLPLAHVSKIHALTPPLCARAHLWWNNANLSPSALEIADCILYAYLFSLNIPFLLLIRCSSRKRIFQHISLRLKPKLIFMNSVRRMLLIDLDGRLHSMPSSQKYNAGFVVVIKCWWRRSVKFISHSDRGYCNCDVCMQKIWMTLRAAQLKKKKIFRAFVWATGHTFMSSTWNLQKRKTMVFFLGNRDDFFLSCLIWSSSASVHVRMSLQLFGFRTLETRQPDSLLNQSKFVNFDTRKRYNKYEWVAL